MLIDLQKGMRSLAERCASEGVDMATALRMFEREVLREQMCIARGSQSRAADLIGVHRNTLSYKMKALGLSVEQIRRELRQQRRQVVR